MIDLLFIQGAGEGAHRADAKLAESLAEHLGADFKVGYPRMPREEEPGYSAWASTFSKELASVAPPFVLVGHSLGASFMLRYLSLNEVDPRPLGLFLVAAPFIGDGGWQVAEFALPTQAGAKLQRMRMFFFQGDSDEVVPGAHLDLYEKVFPHAAAHRLSGRGHQLDDDLAEVATAIRDASSRT